MTLRPPEERNLAAIERGIADLDVVRSFGRAQGSAAELLELNRRRWDESIGATFAICDSAGDCVGHVFVNLGDARRGSVGYWLLPDARGKGMATRAVVLVARWALRDLDLARLGLVTEPWNERSQRVATRAGFRIGRHAPVVRRDRRPTRRLRLVFPASR